MLLQYELESNVKSHRQAAQTLCKTKSVAMPATDTGKGNGKGKKGKKGKGADGQVAEGRTNAYQDGTCLNCGASDHWVAQCPSKGKG